MCLIQPLKFRTLKTGYFEMPRLQMPHLHMAIFQTGITIASGLIFLSSFFAKNNRISLFPECYFWWLAGNRSVRDGLANMNVSPKQKRKDGAYQGLFFSLGAAISHCQLL